MTSEEPSLAPTEISEAKKYWRMGYPAIALHILQELRTDRIVRHSPTEDLDDLITVIGEVREETETHQFLKDLNTFIAQSGSESVDREAYTKILEYNWGTGSKGEEQFQRWLGWINSSRTQFYSYRQKYLIATYTARFLGTHHHYSMAITVLEYCLKIATQVDLITLYSHLCENAYQMLQKNPYDHPLRQKMESWVKSYSRLVQGKEKPPNLLKYLALFGNSTGLSGDGVRKALQKQRKNSPRQGFWITGAHFDPKVAIPNPKNESLFKRILEGCQKGSLNKYELMLAVHSLRPRFTDEVSEAVANYSPSTLEKKLLDGIEGLVHRTEDVDNELREIIQNLSFLVFLRFLQPIHVRTRIFWYWSHICRWKKNVENLSLAGKALVTLFPFFVNDLLSTQPYLSTNDLIDSRDQTLAAEFLVSLLERQASLFELVPSNIFSILCQEWIRNEEYRNAVDFYWKLTEKNEPKSMAVLGNLELIKLNTYACLTLAQQHPAERLFTELAITPILRYYEHTKTLPKTSKMDLKLVEYIRDVSAQFPFFEPIFTKLCDHTLRAMISAKHFQELQDKKEQEVRSDIFRALTHSLSHLVGNSLQNLSLLRSANLSPNYLRKLEKTTQNLNLIEYNLSALKLTLKEDSSPLDRDQLPFLRSASVTLEEPSIVSISRLFNEACRNIHDSFGPKDQQLVFGKPGEWPEQNPWTLGVHHVDLQGLEDVVCRVGSYSHVFFLFLFTEIVTNFVKYGNLDRGFSVESAELDDNCYFFRFSNRVSDSIDHNPVPMASLAAISSGTGLQTLSRLSVALSDSQLKIIQVPVNEYQDAEYAYQYTFYAEDHQ